MMLICTSKTIPYLAINAILAGQHKCTYTTKRSDTTYREEKPVIDLNKTDELKQRNVKNTNAYLSIVVIRKILEKLLVEKKMAKESLIKALGITGEELDKLLFYKSISKLVEKINLPLIKLFCETKFDD